MDIDLVKCVFGAIAALGTGFTIGYRVGVTTQPAKDMKCYKRKEGRRSSPITVQVYEKFTGSSFSCRYKKGTTCLLDNTKCDFTP